MKLQIGLFHRDLRPVMPADLAAIVGMCSGAHADISGQLVDGPVAMVYRGDRICLEEDAETQPLRHGSLVLTFDGRLDNREDLASRLHLTNTQNISDPVLVAKVYEEFGQKAFPDLIGEFALCLWCRRTRTIQFVRSVCGARPLYYVLGRHRLIWSGDFAHLVRISGAQLTTNDAYLLEYLASQPAGHHSPLQEVKAVPAGVCIRFDRDGFTQAIKLWHPNTVRPLHYSSDRDYEEQFREKLAEAVGSRLRARRPVFSELSGGLDSSTVVVTADQILRDRNEMQGNLRTISCVYEQSETCDERYFIDEIEAKRGIDTIYVPEREQRTTLGLRNIAFTGLPNPLHCFPGRYPFIASCMKESGARVLLTGGGGDHLFWSSRDGAPVITDMLTCGKFIQTHLNCLTWSRVSGVPYVRLLQQAFRMTADWVLNRSLRYQRPPMPSWLGEKYKHEFVDLWATKTDPQRGFCPSFRAKVDQVEVLFRQLSAGFLSEYPDIYFSHPYSHRPLVEFCLAIPIAQFLRAGESRSLMRRALHNQLPGKVLHRQSKGALEEPLIRALQREWEDVSDVRQWQLCERGLVEPQELQQELCAMKLGLPSHGHGNRLRVFSLERWLRSLSYVRQSEPPGAMKVPVETTATS